MAVVQLQTRSVSARPAHSTMAGATDAAAPHVWYDMTVEVALSVMVAARAEQLVVRDEDGLDVGVVTRARLTAVRDGYGYTDRLRLGDSGDGGEPFVSPSATRAEAGGAMSFGRRLGPVPVVGEHSSSPGVLALSR
ncbi:CBS domain-containing protein [Streptomyces sp. BK79]|uniref:CBS domain-containing protein n=1 Tax=Streptomyces sp. BK79 TaxID=3350097 RepID=UPI00376FDF30